MAVAVSVLLSVIAGAGAFATEFLLWLWLCLPGIIRVEENTKKTKENVEIEPGF